MKKEVNRISLKAFSYTFEESFRCNRRFCFILGSGASREAGILTGVDMAKIWASELKEKYEEKELEALMEELEVGSINPNSENYFGIYDLRYYPDYQEGYAFFERELEKGTPSLGHYALAKILAGKTHNLAITTNFDSLIEDALFIYTNKHPLVVGHESLTEFINLNIDRPIIAKIHRSLYYHPFNRQQETDGLAEGWKETLRNAFMVYTPVVIGYAGGDRSLMKFLQDDSLKMNGLYWCYWNKEEPTDEIINLVKSKDGCLVPIDGFDQMMFMLSRQLKFENPEEEMKRVTKTRIDRYNAQYEEFEQRIRQEATDNQSSDEVINNTLEEIDKFNLLQLEEVEKKSAGKETFESYYQKGRIYYRMSNYEEAIAEFTKALELQPDSDQALNSRGVAYTSVGKNDKAIADYTKAVELKPDLALIYYNRGVSYYNIKEYGKAIADYTKALELQPDYVSAYHNRGLTFQHLNKHEKAIDDYTKALELQPDSAKNYFSRAYTFSMKSEHDKALTDYTKAIELQSDYKEAYYNRGIVYSLLGENGKAISDYTKALELQPDYKEAYINRGQAYSRIGEHEKAISDYTEAIERKAATPEIYKKRGDIYGIIGRYEEAASDYTKALEMNPEFTRVYDDRGFVNLKMGNYDASLADYTSAIKRDPEDFTAYNNRGYLYIEMGEYDKAVNDLKRSIELKPDFPNAYKHLGKVYFRLKNYPLALEYLNTAIGINPNYKEAQLLKKDINSAMKNNKAKAEGS